MCVCVCVVGEGWRTGGSGRRLGSVSRRLGSVGIQQRVDPVGGPPQQQRRVPPHHAQRAHPLDLRLCLRLIAWGRQGMRLGKGGGGNGGGGQELIGATHYLPIREQ